MKIEFDRIEEQIIKNFKGGEKEFRARMYSDDCNRIMKGSLEPGASIGYHSHLEGSEILFVTSGSGKVLVDDTEEPLKAGDCHYCPMGHSHGLINNGDETLEFYCVVPKHKEQ